MPWPEESCPTCPRREKGLAGLCRAQATNHRRFCELADPAHPEHSEHYRRMLADEPEPAVVLAPSVAHATPPPNANTPAPSVAEVRSWLAKMMACPRWERRSDCGCGLNGCKAGKGRDGIVSHDDCKACLQEREARA